MRPRRACGTLLYSGDVFSLDTGPVKAVNPERAAAKRAARRKDFAKLTRVEGGGLLDDISAAEAEYEAREGFWDNSGVPIEPFHLRQEREAGFFDDEGNYVAFKDGPEDAWLESLPKGAALQRLWLLAAICITLHACILLLLLLKVVHSFWPCIVAAC